MSALFYLALIKGKNKLVELLHKPLKLILTFGFAALLVMNFTLSENSPSGVRPIYEYWLIILAFYLICFVVEIRKSLKSGGSMFSLSDVNLIFTSPIKPSAVLVYGMLSRLGSSLFMSLAFVYQFALLRSFYPVTYKHMLVAVAGYAAVVVLSQLAGMLVAFSSKGHYEDAVLSAAKKEGDKNEASTSVKVKIKNNGRGLGGGNGASVFFRVHMLENRRTKTSLFSPTSLFYLVFIAVYGFIFNEGLFLLFFLSCMVSFLPVLSGKWIKELSMPYIHLVPESPTKKLFYILSEMLIKVFAESAVQCALIGFICRLGLAVTVMLIIARLTVGFVMIATALLTARIFREKEKNSVFLAMSILPGLLFLLPSIIAFAVMLTFGMGLFLSFAAMAAVNMIVAPVILFFARNIFSVSE